jgi:peptidyl-tRNA hydrolase, PTH1 family
MYYVIGLGNPGEEYEKSRHNAGRLAVEKLRKDLDLPEFEFDKKAKALVSKGKKIVLALPETFMNKSGASARYFIKSTKAAQNLIVVYDDMDLPLGTIKIVYNRGSGGHKGLESVARAVKTKEFTRVRIGVSPSTTKGRAKKPSGDNKDDKVLNFILGKFKPTEEPELKKILKKASEAIQCLVEEGRDRAMNMYN